MPIADPTQHSVLTAMITPAFFLTATGAMLGAANTRLARVVDRMRDDLARRDQRQGGSSDPEFARQVAVHRQRSALVLLALRMLYAAMTAFVATSLAIAINTFAGHRLEWLPVTLAICGSLLLFGASVCLGREVRLAMAMLNRELDERLSRDRPV
jgi:hypothetical protein